MAELHFFTGTMDSGKSTLALQTNHNHAARGRVGRIFTTHDRAGQAVVSSRLGLPRLGDVMVACHDDTAVMSTRDFAYEETLVGLHGSLTSTEMLIPILVG